MIDLLLGAVKLVLSEDARKTASGLIEFVRRSPDWQKDICTLEAKVDMNSREHAYLLGGLTADKMQSLGYGADSLNDFKYVYRELTSNAFEHGCKRASKDRVTISIEVTAHYVSVTIRNPPGANFDFHALLERQQAHLSNDSESKRGRGLVICNEFADSMAAVADGDGVKALFYKPSVTLKLRELEGLAIIYIIEGLGNPSIRRRIKSMAEQCLDRDLILDLARFASDKRESEPSSTILTGSLELMETFARAGKKMVVLVPPAPSARIFKLGIFAPSMLAFSVKEAVEKLGRPELKVKIERLINRPQ
jgi:anti-sigma regulatory factor (Ser/Thr protein kinase)